MPMLARTEWVTPSSVDRVAQRQQQALGDQRGGGLVGVLQQDRELVTAQPGRGVVSRRAPARPLGDGDQEQVADAVPEPVVDELEVVEVEEQDRQARSRPAGGPARAQPVARTAARLASPVRESWNAWWVSSSSSRVRWVTSRGSAPSRPPRCRRAGRSGCPRRRGPVRRHAASGSRGCSPRRDPVSSWTKAARSSSATRSTSRGRRARRGDTQHVLGGGADEGRGGVAVQGHHDVGAVVHQRRQPAFAGVDDPPFGESSCTPAVPAGEPVEPGEPADADDQEQGRDQEHDRALGRGPARRRCRGRSPRGRRAGGPGRRRRTRAHRRPGRLPGPRPVRRPAPRPSRADRTGPGASAGSVTATAGGPPTRRAGRRRRRRGGRRAAGTRTRRRARPARGPGGPRAGPAQPADTHPQPPRPLGGMSIMTVMRIGQEGRSPSGFRPSPVRPRPRGRSGLGRRNPIRAHTPRPLSRSAGGCFHEGIDYPRTPDDSMESATARVLCGHSGLWPGS